MNSITYIGMDVHKNSITLCAYEPINETLHEKITIKNDIKELLKFHKKITGKIANSNDFVYGYEAGCLGYWLFKELESYDLECKILAPNTIHNFGNNRVKTDKRDCENIAKTLAYGLGKYVYVPDDEDNCVKEYIRMRDTHKNHLKKTKQQISAFLLRHGYRFTEGKSLWTKRHLKWLRNLEMFDGLEEILEEFLSTYDYLVSKIERLDERIEQMAKSKKYADRVNKLKCLKGIKTHTALSICVEVGDFCRFPKAKYFSSYLGLVPSEYSSGDKVARAGISKTGNCHIRKLLIESAQCFSRGAPSAKSKALKQRQVVCSHDVIEKADAINERLGRRFYRLLRNQKPRNKVVAAVARQLACDI